MNNQQKITNEEQEVLNILQDGGSIHYFYISGIIRIHNKYNYPINVRCSSMTFASLQKKELIIPAEKIEAEMHNEGKKQLYRLANKKD
jgi:hypothetical protein